MEIKIEKTGITSDPEILELINRVFVKSKGRSKSIAECLPNICLPGSTDNVYVAHLNDILVSSVTVRKFIWNTKGQSYKGAMIGLVCTDENARGLGVASKLMNTISKDLKSSDADFAVLWTTIQNFYERAGWKRTDVSAFAQINTATMKTTGLPLITPVRNFDVDYDLLESIRNKWLDERLFRNSLDYKVVPPSVDVVDVYITNSDGNSSYALVGSNEQTAYINEVVGSPLHYKILIKSIAHKFNSIYVNENPNSLFGQWLTKIKLTRLEPQKQAMWLALTDKCSYELFSKWYIPYYDRI